MPTLGCVILAFGLALPLITLHSCNNHSIKRFSFFGEKRPNKYQISASFMMNWHFEITVQFFF